MCGPRVRSRCCVTAVEAVGPAWALGAGGTVSVWRRTDSLGLWPRHPPPTSPRSGTVHLGRGDFGGRRWASRDAAHGGREDGVWARSPRVGHILVGDAGPGRGGPAWAPRQQFSTETGVRFPAGADSPLGDPWRQASPLQGSACLAKPPTCLTGKPTSQPPPGAPGDHCGRPPSPTVQHPQPTHP